MLSQSELIARFRKYKEGECLKNWFWQVSWKTSWNQTQQIYSAVLRNIFESDTTNIHRCSKIITDSDTTNRHSCSKNITDSDTTNRHRCSKKTLLIQTTNIHRCPKTSLIQTQQIDTGVPKKNITDSDNKYTQVSQNITDSDTTNIQRCSLKHHWFRHHK